MHWADVVAEELRERGSEHVVATGITPSGPIHIGNMREVMTADAVHRAARDAGAETRLIYVGDTFDPLRKVYPFLPDDYEAHVGKPLARIPCPCGDHDHYAAHFLEPFLGVLDDVGIDPDVILAHEAYEDGTYAPAIETALDASETIRGILSEVSGRDLDEGWLPFNVLCPECGRLDGSEATAWDPPEVSFRCDCGHEGRVDVHEGGVGKLPWRVDWPARWDLFDVTFEPFGKDHAAAGGSWDTGRAIARQVFDVEPPQHVVYEFLQLKGEGAMHSSTGTAIGAEELLEMTPPEVLRFLLVRPQPKSHIDFDPGAGLIELVDEYDAWEAAYFEGEATAERKELDRVYELSQPDRVPETLPPRIPFKHLVMVAQIADTWEATLEALRRSGYEIPEQAEPRLRERLDHARTWLETFAPEHVRFELLEDPPREALAGLDETQQAFLGGLADRLASVPWEPEAIHEAIHDERGEVDLGAGAAFGAVYTAFLGKDRGPRAGHFLASMDRDDVVARLRSAP